MPPMTGFLPEPLPSAEVAEARVESELRTITSDANIAVDRLMISGTPLFESYKKAIFLAQCETLTVEQAYGRFGNVFEVGIKKASITIPGEEVRKIAEAIGHDATPGDVEETISEPRLFMRWLEKVIVSIAEKHFDELGKPTVVVSVPHLDVPLESGDIAQLVLNYSSVWDDESEAYHAKTFIRKIAWPGRHVIKEAWIDYVLVLMRVICDLDD